MKSHRMQNVLFFSLPEAAFLKEPSHLYFVLKKLSYFGLIVSIVKNSKLINFETPCQVSGHFETGFFYF